MASGFPCSSRFNTRADTLWTFSKPHLAGELTQNRSKTWRNVASSSSLNQQSINRLSSRMDRLTWYDTNERKEHSSVQYRLCALRWQGQYTEQNLLLWVDQISSLCHTKVCNQHSGDVSASTNSLTINSCRDVFQKSRRKALYESTMYLVSYLFWAYQHDWAVVEPKFLRSLDHG